MHDLDRTQNMFESDYQEFEFESDGEYEFEGGGYQSNGEFEALDEVEEMELASELLEISDEYELDQFLGKLMSKAKKAGGGLLKSGLGKSLGGLLKGAAKAALPMIGNMIVPGVGGAAASKLGGMFGLELEGLSPQDQEFEAARSFVKFAGEATKDAASQPPNASPQQVAKAAVIQAAQKHAPGLLRPAGSNGFGGSSSRSGSYGGTGRQGRRVVRVRRGDRITVIGV
jgi:hypothetical protein